MNNLIPLLVLFFTPNILFGQSTLYVPDDFSSIQAGIHGIQDGDTLIVRDGVYYENIVVSGRQISILSENGAATTIIDGMHNGTTFSANHGTYTIDGFTIRNGNRAWHGGGVYAQGYETSPNTLFLKNCIITNNYSQLNGGGLYLHDSSTAIIQNCVFDSNHADGSGGGLCGEQYQTSSIGRGALTLEQTTFVNNTSMSEGGGLYVDNCSIDMLNCVFENNVTDLDFGGAKINDAAWGSRVENCLFNNNKATNGSVGGLAVGNTNGFVVNNTVFSNNFSYQGTGALSVNNGNAVVSKCTFSGNTSYVVWSASCVVSVYNCNLDINSCILWDNDALYALNNTIGTLVVTYSDIEGGYSGVGNINTDPLFTDPLQGDFGLDIGSPCIDAGDPTIGMDPDGTITDMGVYHYPAGNDPPIALDDFVSVQYDTTAIVDALSNDSDPNNNTISITATGTPNNGSAVIANNKVEYTPDQGWSGTDNFVYFIEDTDGNIASATITVEVTRPVYTITNFIAGTYADFRILNAPPNSQVLIGYSLTGPGPTNTSFGPVDMTPPIKTLVTLPADINGDVVFSPLVPAGALGVTFYTQAKCGNMLSNSLALTVQ